MGKAGNDTHSGGYGRDKIYGGLGNDMLVGGGGTDLLHGGPGADKFFRNAQSGNGTDIVLDFDNTEYDSLVFSTGARRNDFRIVILHADDASGGRMGSGNIREVRVVYTPTGETAWTLVEGAGVGAYHLSIPRSTFDLMS